MESRLDEAAVGRTKIRPGAMRAALALAAAASFLALFGAAVLASPFEALAPPAPRLPAVPTHPSLAPAVPSLSIMSRYNFPGVDWRSIQTRHFVIHYYPEEEYTARRVAEIADQVFDWVCDQLHYRLTETVHIVIRDEEEMANGFAVYQQDWVTIWATNLYYRLRGRMDWLPVVLTHEFSHIVSLKLNDPLTERALYGMGIGLYENGRDDYDLGILLPIAGGFSAPTFWIEGGAEYWTHQAGPNAWTPSRDMLLRASVLEDEVLPWEQLQTIAGQSGFDSERVYNHGYAIGLYLRERFGRDVYTKLAELSEHRCPLKWMHNLEEATGVPGDQLYRDWREWLKARYAPMVAEVKAAGLAIGEKIMLTERAKPWEEMNKWEREHEGILRVDSIAQYYPRFSPDGKWLAFYRRGGTIVLDPVSEDRLPQISGKWLAPEERDAIEDGAAEIENANDSAFSFSPDGNSLALSGNKLSKWYGEELALDGSYRNDILIADLAHAEDGSLAKIEVRRLTHGLRAIHPAFSPDGKEIAFIRTNGGNHALGVVEIDRPDEPRWLLEYHDGSQMDAPVWSPDGGTIVFALYKAGQQDLYSIPAGGGQAVPLTFDKAEDRDPAFSPDGSALYFSSDRTGIFNVYAIDLATRSVRQVTNVLGGAFHPFVTASGNLLYSYFTAYGFKLTLLGRDAFFQKDCGVAPLPDPEAARAFVTAESSLPPEVPSEPYRWWSWRNLQAPWVIPVLAFQNEGVKGGFGLVLKDYLEKNTFYTEGLYGEDRDFTVMAVNEMWYPDFYLAYQNVVRALDAGVVTALNPLRPLDVTEVELKQKYLLQILGLGATYPLSEEWEVGVDWTHRDINFQVLSTGSDWDDVIANDFYSLDASFTNFTSEAIAKGDLDVNPRGGRAFTFGYTLGRTHVTPLPGEAPDDIPPTYLYSRLDASYSEYLEVPFWPLSLLHSRALDWLSDHGHSLELSFQGGWIDRNVHVYDEFHAGGRIPLLTSGDFSSNAQFAGYEIFSLSGETLLVASAAYRFPLAGTDGSIDRRLGPIYLDKVFGSVFTTAGNAWGYNIEGERELPFRDTASNGNKMLYDLGTEIRLKAMISNAFRWYSFARVAYGFQDIFGRGQTDVNHDYIIEDEFPQNDMIDEVEKAGIRFYLGLGTGW